MTVHAAFAHRGAAVQLVHNLKYRRSKAAGTFLATAMAERLPEGVDVLVPIPRVLVRRIGHGIDQTGVLAASLSKLTGIPVSNALNAPLWHRRLAGTPNRGRVASRFSNVGSISGRILLIDDVCTTGSTIVSAARALGSTEVSALVATATGPSRLR